MELMMSACKYKSMYAGILIPSSCCCYHRLFTGHDPIDYPLHKLVLLTLTDSSTSPVIDKGSFYIELNS